MRILDLPTEVTVEILIAAVYVRGLRRALRLRLVCKTFDALFNDALFATDLLDEYSSSGGLNLSHFSLENSVPTTYYHFWQSYLALRVQSQKRKLTDRMIIIKRTAELFCLDAGLSGDQHVQECIWALCDIRINANAHSYEEHQPLRAAARGSQLGIVRLLLEHGADPNQCDALIQGTKAGSLDVVRTLLNHGAKPHDSATQLIKFSIRLEHASMFHILREYGALTEEARILALEEAMEEGLDSMVMLLQADHDRSTLVDDQQQSIGDIQYSV